MDLDDAGGAELASRCDILTSDGTDDCPDTFML